MSILSQGLKGMFGVPEVNLKKLIKGDKKEQEKSAPFVAEVIEASLPQLYSTEVGRWFDTMVGKLPILVVEQLHKACARRMAKENEV